MMEHNDTVVACNETTPRRTVSRRALIKRAAVLGLSTPLVAALPEISRGIERVGAASQTRVNLYHTIPAATETFWKKTLLPTFAKQHPECQLVPDQLGTEDPTVIRAKLRAGGASAPDMAWLASTETGAYVQANLLPDVQTWLNAHPQIKNDIFPSLLTLSSFQGQVRSLPWMTNNTAMWINLDAFHEAGVPTPSQDPEKTWTWDQFAEACAKLSKIKGMKGFLMTNGGTWDTWCFHAWLGANNGVFLPDNGTPSFASSAGIETMTFLQDLVKKGYTAYSQPNKGYDASPWYSGKVAITANGPWNFPDLVSFNKFKFTVVPYPRNKKPATNTGGDQLFVFNRSAAKVACSFAYAQYMLTDAFQVAFNIESGNLPVTKSATASAPYQAHLKKYPFLAGFVNSVPYGIARSSLPYSNDVETVFSQKAWDPIVLQMADVKSSLQAAASAASALKQ